MRVHIACGRAVPTSSAAATMTVSSVCRLFGGAYPLRAVHCNRVRQVRRVRAHLASLGRHVQVPVA
eukprot:2721696-Prymnesium_polylepis.1